VDQRQTTQIQAGSQDLTTENIKPAILQEYLKIGFKLVSLLEDSDKPTLKWKPIYQNPRYWTPEKLAENYSLFANVACVPGPVIVKDEETGKEIQQYNVIFDIDGENAYSKLAPLIEQWKKETFVVKSYKPWGYHIHFRTNELFESIKAKEFEFKSDGNAGTMHLPPSKHRKHLDTDFRYTNVGQKKIAYKSQEEIEVILNELAEFIQEPKEDTSDEAFIPVRELGSMPEEVIQRAANAIKKYYIESHRNYFSLAYHGTLRRIGVSREDALAIGQAYGSDKVNLARIESVYNFTGNVQGQPKLAQRLKEQGLDDVQVQDALAELLTPIKEWADSQKQKDIDEYYLKTVEQLQDPDLLLRLIEDDEIEAFRSGINNQVYLIVPRADDKGKEQIPVPIKTPGSDFGTYARRVFERDYQRIEPLKLLVEQMKVVASRLKEEVDAELEAELKAALRSLQTKFGEIARDYKEKYGHRPTIHNRVVGEESINSVARQLMTFAKTYRTLHLRSFVDANGWYYDIQNDKYEYIAITKDGYSKKNDAYYYFRRTSRQGTNDNPIECDFNEGKQAFENLFANFNFVGPDGSQKNEQQKTLFEIFTLWLYYNEHRTMRPIEGINASPNSGKTTLLRIQKSLYDPVTTFASLTKSWGAGKKDDRRDRFVTASNHAFIVFDNVKYATSEEQDDLCLMATGGTLPTRKLFTDSEMHEIEIQTNVAYTSVNDIATYADLLRRQIQFKLNEAEIDINEDALFDYLRASRAKILHWIFTVLSGAQKKLASVNANNYTKFRGLWKFVMIGDAIAYAMGKGENYVSQLFADIPLQQAQRAVENDAFAGAFLRYVMNTPELRLVLTSNEIKTKVEEYCSATKDYTSTKDHTWPETAKGVSSKLEYLTPTFKAFKVTLERGGLVHGYRPWIITKQLDDEGTKKGEEPFSKDDKMFKLIASELQKEGPIQHEPLRIQLINTEKFSEDEADAAIEGAVKIGVLEVRNDSTYQYNPNQKIDSW
jgi:hypothetical protein